jgi:hypothetical protein
MSIFNIFHKPLEVKAVEFIPKKGVRFLFESDKRSIEFGMPRDTVRQIMMDDYSCAEPTARSASTDCYFDNSLQFSFEQDQTLSFIEAASPPPIGVKLFHLHT